MSRECKKIGVLSLIQKSLLELIFRLEQLFEDLKKLLFEWYEPNVFTFSAHKGLTYVHLDFFFFEPDNCKWSKMAIKVGFFWWLHSPLLHCEIRKLYEDESLHSVQPTCCTGERGPEVFPHLRMKYHKTETPRPPTGVHQVGCTLSGKLFIFI